jgi:predicted short-subunit dehydrogenase-like oxidoreductase (DUF2520 family)
MPIKIYIIGAGRLGTSLARALSVHHHFTVVGLQSNKALHPADLNGIPNPIEFTPGTVRDVRIILLAIGDDQIAGQAKLLAESGVDWSGKSVWHHSGLLTSEELMLLRRQGAEIASLHPMQSFPRKFMPTDSFKAIYWAYEGSQPARALAKEICTVLGGNMVDVPADKKEMYHLGATVSANFLTGLLHIAEKLYGELGWDAGQTAAILKPILTRCIENMSAQGAQNSLSGPVSRGDAKTVARHRETLQRAAPEADGIYRVISRYLLDNLATLSPEQQNELERILND